MPEVIVLISRPELCQVAQRAGAHGIIKLWEPPQKALIAILTFMCEDGGLLLDKHGTSNSMLKVFVQGGRVVAGRAAGAGGVTVGVVAECSTRRKG